MLSQILITLLGCILATQCRDLSKPFRSIPTITGSLVNLGKMDISFHFNGKESPLKHDGPSPPHHSFFLSKLEPIIEDPCLCSGLRGFKDSSNHPSEILNKILTSGDLFSFNREPTSSTLCCGSHEHAQEDIVTFEFGPKDVIPINPPAIVPRLPFIFENILSKRPFIQPTPPKFNKQKSVEILLFPKKKDASMFIPVGKDFFKNDNIKVVGDKEFVNDFKTLKYRPSIPINSQASVKKDLTAQEKNEFKKDVEKEEIEVTTAANPNSIK